MISIADTIPRICNAYNATVSGLVVYDVPFPDFKVRLAREVPGDLATTLWMR